MSGTSTYDMSQEMVSMDRNRKTISPGPAVAHVIIVLDIAMDGSGRPGQPGMCTACTAKN